MSAGITAQDLADRVRASTGNKIATTEFMVEALETWERQGVVERLADRWRITRQGRAMFAGWMELEEREAA